MRIMLVAFGIVAIATVCEGSSASGFDLTSLSEDQQILYATLLSQGRSPTVALKEAQQRKAVSTTSYGYIDESDDASLALATQLQEEEEGESKQDEASLALIAKLQQGAYTAFSSSPTVYKILTNQNIQKHRVALAPSVELIQKTQQESNVHGLDAHVAANIGVLNAIGADLGVDNATLTVANMKSYLEAYIAKNSGFYKGYGSTAVSPAQLSGYIDAALATASQDAITLQTYSRVVSLLQVLEKENVDTITYLQDLLDAICENYLTQGGCFVGVRNRGFVRYVAMLHSLMGA